MADFSTYRQKARPQPPLRLQFETSKCWAYALASWLQVRNGGEYFDPDALIDKWQVKGALNAHNAETVLRGEGARYVHTVKKPEFTAAYIIGLLDYTYVYLAYQRLGGLFAHCVVMYGVRGGSNAKVAIMDPMTGYRFLPLPVDLADPPIEKLLIAH